MFQAPTPARKCDISYWFPCGADRRVDGCMDGVQSSDNQNFSDA